MIWKKLLVAILLFSLTLLGNLLLFLRHYECQDYTNSPSHFHNNADNNPNQVIHTKPQVEEPRLQTWLKSWNDTNLLASSPLANIFPQLISHLNKSQNPSDCSISSFLVYDPLSRDGFGSMIKNFITAFHLAIITNRVFLISSSTNFFWTDGCLEKRNEGKLDCFFQPLSNTCPYEKVKQLIKRRKLSTVRIRKKDHSNDLSQLIERLKDISDPNVVFFDPPPPKKLPMKHILYRYNNFSQLFNNILSASMANENLQHLQTITAARRVWITSLTYYLLRLNRETAYFVYDSLKRILQTEDPQYSQFIGVPVRGSDKCKSTEKPTQGEMKCMSLSTIMNSVHRVAFAAPSVTHAILTSEDIDAISNEKVQQAREVFHTYRPLTIVRNMLDHPPGTGRASRDVFNSTPAHMLRSSLVTIYLQALPEYHVLAPRSNYHSLIYALSQTIPRKERNFMYPIGDWKSIAFSEVSQFM